MQIQYNRTSNGEGWDLRGVGAGPDAPNASVSIGGEIVTCFDDAFSCACRVGLIDVALQAKPLWCVSRGGSNSKGGIGERPVCNAIVRTGAIATETCDWIQDRRIDVVAGILGLIPPTAKCVSESAGLGSIGLR